jgi:hypothetical protein
MVVLTVVRPHSGEQKPAALVVDERPIHRLRLWSEVLAMGQYRPPETSVYPGASYMLQHSRYFWCH